MDLRSLPSTEHALAVLAHPNSHVCFSQFGEDMVVLAMLSTMGRANTPGFYVDVGAFDPINASNTYALHLRGWSGVNIDANPAAIERFQAARPYDQNVHAAVSDRETEVEFTIYHLAGLSTADPAAKAAYEREGRAHGARTMKLHTRKLRDILAAIVPQGRAIDLMSIDVEGFDLNVLRSNDWERFAPFFLLVEDPGLSLVDRPRSEIFDFLQPLGYRLASQTYITSIYLRDQQVRL
jgi:FkbM family methyltransferase